MGTEVEKHCEAIADRFDCQTLAIIPQKVTLTGSDRVLDFALEYKVVAAMNRSYVTNTSRQRLRLIL
jgi:hypothetical protein